MPAFLASRAATKQQNGRGRAATEAQAAVLLGLRRALRNGSLWIAHSLNFCSRKQLLIPEERWTVESRRHYSQLALPARGGQFLVPLLKRLKSGFEAVAPPPRAASSPWMTTCISRP
jgi:hypothetical protein